MAIRKTAKNMNHKYGVYESASSPSKRYCANTVTMGEYVFGQDQIGNFLYAYVCAKANLEFGQTLFAATIAALVTDGKPDESYDRSAYEAGYAFGLTSVSDFKTILESMDICTMQSENAKRGWPSAETAVGTIYPTWGAIRGGLQVSDQE